jgi:hypothetical protein
VVEVAELDEASATIRECFQTSDATDEQTRTLGTYRHTLSRRTCAQMSSLNVQKYIMPAVVTVPRPWHAARCSYVADLKIRPLSDGQHPRPAVRCPSSTCQESSR